MNSIPVGLPVKCGKALPAGTPACLLPTSLNEDTTWLVTVLAEGSRTRLALPALCNEGSTARAQAVPKTALSGAD